MHAFVAFLCLAVSDSPWIDKEIQGEERALLEQVLRPYGTGFTGEAIFIDRNGIAHSNRIETTLEEAIPIQDPNYSHRWSKSGEKISLPSAGLESGPPASPNLAIPGILDVYLRSVAAEPLPCTNPPTTSVSAKFGR